MATFKPMLAMLGISDLSTKMLLPTKNASNMRPFLACLISIMQAALDDQVTFSEFIPRLAERVKIIQKIMEEEKA